MPGLIAASWSDIEVLRARVGAGTRESVQEAADQFTALFATRFSTIVLARLFLVVPLEQLPPGDRAFVRARLGDDPRLVPSTPVLSLLRRPRASSAGCPR